MKPNVTAVGYDRGRLADDGRRLAAASRRARSSAGSRQPPIGIVPPRLAYNARGQRAAAAYGNGVTTKLCFDPLTFRLTAPDRASGRRSFAANAQTVQDLRYFYDPVGNITRIRDDADIQNVVFFANQRVEPSSDYTYDPLYRLISAQGREHLGQTGSAFSAAAQVDRRRFLPHPSAAARRRQRDGNLCRKLQL